MSILESLTRRGSLSVATTHLGLSKISLPRAGIERVSAIDSVALAPTYRLIKGIPGRSYGLSIARRLQLPEDVLDRAEALFPQVSRDVNALLASSRQGATAQRDREGNRSN